MRKTTGKPIVARPNDDSFEAYHDWIKGLFAQLTGKAWDENKISDEELRDDWEKRKSGRRRCGTS